MDQRLFLLTFQLHHQQVACILGQTLVEQFFLMKEFVGSYSPPDELDDEEFCCVQRLGFGDMIALK